jgi:protein-disulfide isomerase
MRFANAHNDLLFIPRGYAARDFYIYPPHPTCYHVPMQQSSTSNWLLPGAILFTGIVIAVSIFMVREHAAVSTNGHPEAATPVSTADHELGNPTAPVVVIEYSDIDSQYAIDFQQVMGQIVQNYSNNGSVAWVFRHFPLASTDANAEEHAEAAECISAVGGSSGFFKFVSAMQQASPTDGLFDPSNYDAVVTGLGYSSKPFDACLAAHTYKKQVEADYENALKVGATGSPYSIIEVRGQKPVVISGSVPYSTMKQVIDGLLQTQLNSK